MTVSPMGASGMAPMNNPPPVQGTTLAPWQIAMLVTAEACEAKACKDEHNRGWQGVLYADGHYVATVGELFSPGMVVTVGDKTVGITDDQAKALAQAFAKEELDKIVQPYVSKDVLRLAPWLSLTALYPTWVVEVAAANHRPGYNTGLLLARDSNNELHVLAYTANHATLAGAKAALEPLRQKLEDRRRKAA